MDRSSLGGWSSECFKEKSLISKCFEEKNAGSFLEANRKATCLENKRLHLYNAGVFRLFFGLLECQYPANGVDMVWASVGLSETTFAL